MEVSLVYRSLSLLMPGEPDFQTLLQSIDRRSRTNNAELDVTGFLIYKERQFYQILEGSFANVTQIFNVISRDNRHTEIELLSFSSITGRAFKNWSMQSSIDVIATCGEKIDMRMKFMDNYVEKLKPTAPFFRDILRSIALELTPAVNMSGLEHVLGA